MRVFIEREKRRKNISYSGTVSGLLKKLSLNSETVLVVRNEFLLSSDELVSNRDSIRILSVISGG
ncbi:MoaD/ThiS family protein [Candidatus Woesearchaeota archaeon]|nr:MoaD/ThiS family protein [Candidatus Woesearchaeota archaeon]